MSQNGSERRDTPETETVHLVLKEAKDLVRTLEGTGVSRVRIEAGSFTIEVERASGVVVGAVAGVPAGGTPAVPAAATAAPGVMPVVAPLVGVFYHAASPGAPPFVQVGDTVERGQVVGIVEAMKVMNEVTSDYRGVVTEILVENGEAVQYEQRLLLIDTAGRAE